MGSLVAGVSLRVGAVDRVVAARGVTGVVRERVLSEVSRSWLVSAVLAVLAAVLVVGVVRDGATLD
ncbi:hypothetical protein FA951_02690 [Dermacoccus nishinomiyaensis]|uniref:Uncharacterized protein n=1 Tax=Dermacoccus nishinomiyaensis TaxID=1274 RepID=A0A075JF16_9MICO|nr:MULTISPECIES: hypothetical protein [Dermacoccus]AIF39807.1 hypothetical protein HX89_01025 [Dermacoccus nishinomiyaensis]MCG7429858.1 hypothetical protein [Dermacoccus nishinomiyaensis]TJZ98094.1 hypothetical protein FA951_02690 [Dermacoccus nishinomiyaensis]